MLWEIEERLGIINGIANCFRDYRDPDRIEFSLRELLTQQIMGPALGYEDLNDHDVLRSEQLLVLMVRRKDVTGQDYRYEQDRSKPLAVKEYLYAFQLKLARILLRFPRLPIILL